MRSLLTSLTLAASFAAACPLAAQDQNSEVIPVGADMFLRWYGHADRTYFVQISDPNDHLRKWIWAPIIETGNDENISYEVDGTADKGFFRLWFIDEPTADPDGGDFDGDGLNNLAEVLTHQTNPLKDDTDGDGLLDGWEIANSLDPNDDGTVNINNGASGDPDHDGLTNEEEQDLGTDPNDADSDDDGITDGGENDQGTDPNDPEDTPDAEWFILTGDLDEDEVKTRSRTITIPAGKSRVIAVVVASDEYDYYTDPETANDYNDTFEWDIQPSEGDALEGSIDVNARHDKWDDALLDGRECRGFSPAHVENGMTLTAPDDAPLTVEIELSATNIGDGVLPSTVLVGVLPVIPVEFFPQLLDGDGVVIAGSENPRTEPDQTNGMTEENPVANRIAHREIKMKIVDGEVLEDKELTWTMEPLYVHPDEQDPAFRGEWTHSTNHNTYFEISAQYGAYDFAAVAAQPTPVSATTAIDESAESALRINLPPIGFNQGRVKIAVEGFQGDPAKVADMEVPAVVVIDPGHGGPETAAGNTSSWNNAVSFGVDPPLSNDPKQQGESWEDYYARVGKTLEKDLTLLWGLELRTDVATAFDDGDHAHYRILMTRTTDVNPTIAERPQIARDNGADIFFSIHFNGHTSTAIHGPETWIETATAGNVNHANDLVLAERTQDALDANIPNAQQPGQAGYRGIKQGTVSGVFRDSNLGNQANQPPHVRACLAEMDWITNEDVEISLISGPNAATNRGAVLDGVAGGIVEDVEYQE
jgi:N-acetylmuramoyl-L-alanine amidase